MRYKKTTHKYQKKIMNKKYLIFPGPARNILARRLINKTLLFAMVTTVLLTIIIGCIAYFVEKESLERQFKKIESSYIDFIRPALWITDTEMINALLMGMGDFHEIEYAGIYVNGTLFSETGQKPADQQMDWIFPITHLYDGKTYQLGELHVKKNHGFVKKQIFRAVFIAAATQALTIFIICGAVLWLMYQSLIQRLLAIARYTSTMSMESLGTPLILEKSSEQPDELDGLADAVNHMRQNLQHEFLRRKKAEDSIREHRDNLEKIVEERTVTLKSTNEKLMQEIDERKQIESEREALIADLQTAVSEIKTLSGLLPICMHCKKIRDDKGYWQQMETYIHEHSDAQFSHSICRECAEEHYPDLNIYDD
jgi:methyl-accepting chemotaxis protein